MCGIYAILSSFLGGLDEASRKRLLDRLQSHHKNLELRGPEDQQVCEITPEVMFAFYRLEINGLNMAGMQPFHLDAYPNLHVMCNGEIYNHAELAKEIDYENKSGSDCEIIVPLVARYGFAQTLKSLDGVFAIAVYDSAENKLWLGRDPLGVRPLFVTTERDTKTGKVIGIQAASELKAMLFESPADPNKRLTARAFIPGSYACYRFNPKTGAVTPEVEDRYFVPSWNQNCAMTLPEALTGINKMFRLAIEKRLMSERPIGCLLSGGLDSSLVASIVAEKMAETGRKIHTFSVGMAESTDLIYARKVAEHIGSIHHEFLLSQEEFLAAIDHVIWLVESWDTTTIRASVGNYLVAKKISDFNKDREFLDRVIVIFNGDGSDELIGGYLYHHRKSPTPLDFHLESERLLQEIYTFDVLRSDRTIADNGLEARTPFLDRNFINYFMSIPVALRANKYTIEKWLLREAFRADNLLPECVLNRSKEAFSDGVSGTEKSWWEIIQDWTLEKRLKKGAPASVNQNNFISGAIPQTVEAAYYMERFQKYYPGQDSVIPHYWLPKWSGKVINPSARVLDVYTKESQIEKTAAA